LKETGKIDGLVGAKEVGRILDFYNQTIDKKRERDYKNDINDRNKYYWKLWLMAMQAKDRGEIAKPRSKPKIII
jgi:hypothetical protein